MSSYYLKRIKSRQIQDAKHTRARRGTNNRKNYRKLSNGGLCSEEFYSPSNKFGSAQSRKIAAFLRQCKKGDKTSIEVISTKLSKASIARGFELAMTFGHTRLVSRFIELGVTNYFSFQPVKIHPRLKFSTILSFTKKRNDLRFYEWFVSQKLSQENVTYEFVKQLLVEIRNDDLSPLKILLRCHPNPTSIIDSKELLMRNIKRCDVMEVLLEYEPKVSKELVDCAIQLGFLTVLDKLLKIDGVEPKHSLYPLPRLLDLGDGYSNVILGPNELNVVRTLLKYGADLHETDHGMNLLHSAAALLCRNDKYGREVMDFMFEYMFEFDYADEWQDEWRKKTWLVVDLLPEKYKKEYETKMVRRIQVVREIVSEVGQVSWDCATIVAVCLHGKTVRMLSLM